MIQNQQRYSVICDLTEEEYRLQQRLASPITRRQPPWIMRLNSRGHWIAEHQISRIAVDAWAAAHGLEASDQAQDEVQEAALLWPLTDKLKFLDDAGHHWIPHMGDATCYWAGTPEQARAFLSGHPGITRILQRDTCNEQSARDMATKAIALIGQMTEFPYESADWQQRWEQVRGTLHAIADDRTP